MHRRIARSVAVVVAATVVAVAAIVVHPERLDAWGAFGHRMIGRVATNALPREMPAFFTRESARLAFLSPEPDQWRDGAENAVDSALTGATGPDHFLDLEMIPAAKQRAFLSLNHRFEYADSLRAIKLDAEDVGVLPYRIVEMMQLLRTDFRHWRAAKDSTTREWIEQRIINDAGMLSHYVADASQPLHTTMNYAGWTGANPNGYSTDKRIHSRFESLFVQSHVSDSLLARAIPRDPKVISDLRGSVIAYVLASNAQVAPLYELEKRAPFDSTSTDAEHTRFVVDRMAAGATMLRDLWWTAWVTSAPTTPVTKER